MLLILTNEGSGDDSGPPLTTLQTEAQALLPPERLLYTVDLGHDSALGAGTDFPGAVVLGVALCI